MIIVVVGPLPQALAGCSIPAALRWAVDVQLAKCPCATRKGIKQISVTLWAASYPYARSVTESAHNQPRPPPAGWQSP